MPDWLIRFLLDALIFFILFFILFRPLWKLAMSRTGLIIVFSRAIGNLLRLLADLPNFIYFNILNIETTPYLYVYLTNGSIRILTTVQHTHNLALAINRAHGMFFPFHYNMVYAKKKNIYVLCFFLWLISFCLGGSDQFVRELTGSNPSIRLANGFSPAGQLNSYCMIASAVFYAALGSRMLWMKYKQKTCASTENDSIKILITCFSCLLMSTLNQVFIEWLVIYSLANFREWSITIGWIKYLSYLLGLCTEEICLAILVRDFRKNIRNQLSSLIPCNFDSSNLVVDISASNRICQMYPHKSVGHSVATNKIDI